ncbi:MAG: hypothetical protein JO327_13375 [Nitrososphaeraceae archaeon]|nr:hypothetical protein [Nitrososphaeraceae archaeon]MBV9669105.1 hypothetical protein [Nitrososphaeraceae archaeon]
MVKITTNTEMMKNRHFNNNNNKTRKASNRSFEGEPITFQSRIRNKKQTNSSSQDKNMNDKRKIMFVIPTKLR